MLLQVSGVCAGYYNKRVLHDVSLSVAPGEVVSLIGHNGAGKTTTLKTVLGLLRSEQGEVVFDGRSVARDPVVRNVRSGMYLIPQERFTFPDLTVEENLMLGAHYVADADLRARTLEEIYGRFPILQQRGEQRAGTMSGGQQRLLSIATAMMSQPRLVMVDEPSLGLAPRIVEEITGIIAALAARGLAVVLVDQNVKQTLKISDRVYVMKNGRIVLEDTGQKLLQRGSWWDLF